MPGQAPPLSDERPLLLAYIDQQRDGIRNAAYGLTDEQARLTPCASSLSIGGLVKHAADTERGWIDMVLQRDRDAAVSNYEDNFGLGPGETLAEVLASYDEVGRHAGHADIVRESIDGATMYLLMAAAEGWPPTEWIQPWQPEAAR